MDFVIANQEKVNAMIKTTLKIDGMMCGMCESHMNDLIRKNFQVKKVTSSAKDGETVIISDNEIDIPWAKKRSKRLVTNSFPTRVNHMRKKDFPFWKIIGIYGRIRQNAQVLSGHLRIVALRKLCYNERGKIKKGKRNL